MRVCIIVPGFSSSESDWCIPALRDLVRWLSGRHEVWLLALRYPYRSDAYTLSGARVRSLGAEQGTGLRRALMLGRAIRAVAAEHRRAPFNLIHGLWADEAGFLAAACGRLLGRPSMVSVMGGELVGWKEIGYGVQLSAVGRHLVGRSLRAAHMVTVGSEGLRRLVELQRVTGPIRRLPLGVDLERFSDRGEVAPLTGDPRLLAVASLTPIKDHRTLLLAFAEVARESRGAHLHLVGDGPLRARLEELARALDLGGRAVFHGAIVHDRLAPVYRGGDLHIVSSIFESQGMAALEAAACGTGTVGTAVGVLPELRDGVPTVAVGDAPAMAREVLALVEAPEGSRELGRAARASIVRQGLDLETRGAGFEALYREVSDRSLTPSSGNP